jgi:hypothetical protein
VTQTGELRREHVEIVGEELAERRPETRVERERVEEDERRGDRCDGSSVPRRRESLRYAP